MTEVVPKKHPAIRFLQRPATKHSVGGDAMSAKRPDTSRPNVSCCLVVLVVLFCAGSVLVSQGSTRWASCLAEEAAMGKLLTLGSGSGSTGDGKDTENGKLTKKRLTKIAPDGILITTMVNNNFLDFADNWLYHLEELGLSNYIIGAMDDVTLEELIKKKFNCFDMDAGLPSAFIEILSDDFYKLGSAKTRLIMQMLEMGFNIIFSDIDLVFTRNPIPYWKKYWRADLLMSSDHRFETHTDGGLEDPTKIQGGNIGMLMMKPSTMDLVKEWLHLLTENKHLWDQEAFGRVLGNNRESSKDDPDRLFKDVNETILMGYLPIAQFGSGDTYFYHQMDRKWHLPAYTAHATFASGGPEGKRLLLREALLWNDPPEYFDRPNGFIGFEPDIPRHLLENAAPKFPDKSWLNDTLGHFALVNHQLTQIRKALAIAHILNRTLVMPEIWCGQTTHWHPHPGVVWGSTIKLPYRCSLGQVLSVPEIMPSPGEDRKPFIEIKEHSFFRNIRLPESVKRSALKVMTCDESDPGCGKGGLGYGDLVGEMMGTMYAIDNNPDPEKFYIKPNLTDVGIKEAFANKGDNKILYFSSMLDAFGGFEDKNVADEFENRVKLMTWEWCCVDTGVEKHGGVHYDLFNDVIPHADKFGRVYNGSWYPIVGTE